MGLKQKSQHIFRSKEYLIVQVFSLNLLMKHVPGSLIPSMLKALQTTHTFFIKCLKNVFHVVILFVISEKNTICIKCLKNVLHFVILFVICEHIEISTNVP